MANEHFEAVIVLGARYKLINGQPSLSYDGYIRAGAAAKVYKDGLTDRLIFTGGKTRGPLYPSEAEEIESQARLEFLARTSMQETIPEDATTLEEGSIDTRGNFEQLLKDPNFRTSERVAVLTSGYHLKSALTVARNAGLNNPTGLSAEDILRGIEPYQSIINAYNRSLSMFVSRAQEAIRVVLLTVDPNSRLLRRVTQLTRT